MSTIHEAYTDLISTLKDLEGVLRPAVAAQYDAPPGGTGDTAPNGISNPTLDTVIDPRREGLSDEIRRTAEMLSRATRLLTPQVPALGAALARWEGETP
jgi:hypothetical protein